MSSLATQQAVAARSTTVLEAPARPLADLRTELDARLQGFATTPEQSADGGTLILTVPAAAAGAETFLDLADFPQAFLWQAPDGVAFVGQGAAHHLVASGRDRFEALKELAQQVLKDVSTEGFGGLEAPEPRLWGGLAFDEGAASSAPWSAFGDAQLVLPRFLYRRGVDKAPANGSGGDSGAKGSPTSATLSLAVTASEAADSALRASLLDQLDELLAGLAQPAGLDPAPVPLKSTRQVPPDELIPLPAESDDAGWVRRVEDIRAAIAEGTVEKIVASRRFRIAVAPDLDISTVLRRLARGLRSSTRFAFRHRAASGSAAGDVTFLGATPERLVSKRGTRLETEALAGTMEAGGEHAAELLGSGKNRHEQQLVTDSIVRRLRPLCTRLEVADRPTVRELRDILHLHTPIRGVLAGDHHVLDLVKALHPTPAVGGVPTPEAMRWIRDNESHPRGWYAAPIGWLDARGDGEFYVALRSCVVAGDQAFLYAGAGIVGDSDPLAELRETELKTHALRGALRS